MSFKGFQPKEIFFSKIFCGSLGSVAWLARALAGVRLGPVNAGPTFGGVAVVDYDV